MNSGKGPILSTILYLSARLCDTECSLQVDKQMKSLIFLNYFIKNCSLQK